MTRTEKRRATQAELDRLSKQVKLAPKGQINAWRRYQVQEVARMLKEGK